MRIFPIPLIFVQEQVHLSQGKMSGKSVVGEARLTRLTGVFLMILYARGEKIITIPFLLYIGAFFV